MLAQAYSRLYCQKDSPLRQELLEAWRLYKGSDEATVNLYSHLFPGMQDRENVEYVTFQQVVLRNQVTALDGEELSAVEEFINVQHQEAVDLRKHPWKALRVDEAQLDIDLERQYVER